MKESWVGVGLCAVLPLGAFPLSGSVMDARCAVLSATVEEMLPCLTATGSGVAGRSIETFMAASTVMGWI